MPGFIFFSLTCSVQSRSQKWKKHRKKLTLKIKLPGKGCRKLRVHLSSGSVLGAQRRWTPSPAGEERGGKAVINFWSWRTASHSSTSSLEVGGAQPAPPPPPHRDTRYSKPVAARG